MVGSRTATAVAGLIVSVAVSVAAWYYFDTLVAFLLVPFVPVLLGRGDDATPRRTCSACGFTSRDPSVEYCPRDGTRLDRSADDDRRRGKF
jgi:hypothetical protein